MDTPIFMDFKPLNSNNLDDIYSSQSIGNYYQQHGINPDNDFLANYLKLDSEKNTDNKSEVVVGTTSQPKSLSELIYDIKKNSITSSPSDQTQTQTQTTTTQNKPTAVATNTNSSTTVKSPAIKSKKDFLKIYAPLANKAAKETGLAEDLILAQIALETGWGKHAPGNNIAGIKANQGWKGKRQNLHTKEWTKDRGYYNDTAEFRAYDTPAEGFQGYINFLSNNSRYKKLFGVSDPYRAAEIMGTTGYATSTNYTNSLKGLITDIKNIKAQMA